jgi:hypothetical protein
MKTTLLKTTLIALSFAGLGIASNGAQADGNRGGDAYGHGYQNSHAISGKYAYQQSTLYSQQINARQNRQMVRIQAGMRTGQLTRPEFRRLMQEQHRIRAMEHHFRADGRINAREFQHLDRALDVASRNIMADKHDRQHRYVYGAQHPLPLIRCNACQRLGMRVIVKCPPRNSSSS